MPRGDKSAYTDKQKRQAEHIEKGYEDRGLGKRKAASRAWATVNKESGGGKKSGAGRKKHVSSQAASSVVYDDLLVELSSSCGRELTHEELALLVNRPEDQVLGALMDLQAAGLVHYLERDLDSPELGDRWAPADDLRRLRIKAWLDDNVFDLSKDIDPGTSFEMRDGASPPRNPQPEARF